MALCDGLHFDVATGSLGVRGGRGPEGPEGHQGIPGAIGPRGPLGPIGEDGLQGRVGVEGPKGPKGPTGGQADVSSWEYLGVPTGTALLNGWTPRYNPRYRKLGTGLVCLAGGVYHSGGDYKHPMFVLPGGMHPAATLWFHTFSAGYSSDGNAVIKIDSDGVVTCAYAQDIRDNIALSPIIFYAK